MAHSRWRSLAPLVLATMASQALLVVLAPTIVAISRDFDVPVGLAGQARSITAVVAISTSVAVSVRAEALGVPRVIRLGAWLAIAACGAVAMSGTAVVFLTAHVLVGLSFALLLSGGFAGVAAFSPELRAWATGFVAGANALAWIVVNPLAAVLTEWLSWRAAQVVPATIGLAALLVARDAAPVPSGSASTSLWAPFRSGSARWWMGAEVVAFGAWTALLTFAGALFIDGFGARESTTGLLLAAGAAAYFVGSTRCGPLVRRVPLRRLVAGSALVMAVLLPVVLNVTSLAAAVALFCLTGLVAGIRTPASASLALEQLPDRPGAMMAARTAATQLGYLIGAVIGGAVIAGPGYGALGLALAVGMGLSAWLVLRVNKPPRADSPHPEARTAP